MDGSSFLSVLLVLSALVSVVCGASIGGVSDQAVTKRLGKKYKTCDKELQVRKFILCATVDLYIDDWATSNLIAKTKANQNRGGTRIEDCCLDGCSDWSLLGFCLDEREQYTINNNVIDEGVSTVREPKQHRPKSRRNRFEVGTVAPEFHQTSIHSPGSNNYPTNHLD